MELVTIHSLQKGVNKINGKNFQKNLITNLKNDDFDYSMPNAISNIMNEHFFDIGPKLINAVPKSKSSYKDYIPQLKGVSL